jgi:hypothetical protein
LIANNTAAPRAPWAIIIPWVSRLARIPGVATAGVITVPIPVIITHPVGVAVTVIWRTPWTIPGVVPWIIPRIIEKRAAPPIIIGKRKIAGWKTYAYSK